MRKLILIIIILLLFMTGCGKLKKVVEVTFHINEEQEIVACEYGIILNKSYISIYNEDEIEGIIMIRNSKINMIINKFMKI